jgi:hypothetical protein
LSDRVAMQMRMPLERGPRFRELGRFVAALLQAGGL